MSFCFHTIANILTKVKSVTANDIIIIIKVAGVVGIFICSGHTSNIKYFGHSQ